MKRGNVTIVIMAVIIGLAFIAGAVYLYIRANEESERIYQDMIEEAQQEEEDSPYGFGALPDPDLADEGLEAWAIQELYMFKTHAPNKWIEIEDVLDLKLKALMCHESQFSDLVPDGDMEKGMNLLRMMTGKHPKTGKLAECLRHMPLEGLEGLAAYVALDTGDY